MEQQQQQQRKTQKYHIHIRLVHYSIYHHNKFDTFSSFFCFVHFSSLFLAVSLCLCVVDLLVALLLHAYYVFTRIVHSHGMKYFIYLDSVFMYMSFFVSQEQYFLSHFHSVAFCSHLICLPVRLSFLPVYITFVLDSGGMCLEVVVG